MKNKVAPPFKKVEFDIIYGKGISRSGDVLDLSVAEGYVRKSGSWFSYGDEKLGQGRNNARDYLESHSGLMEELDRKIRIKYELIEPAEAEKE